LKHSRGDDQTQTKWSLHYHKPRLGMLHLAMVRHKHSPQDSLYVGDRPRWIICSTTKCTLSIGIELEQATSRGDRPEDKEAAQRAGIPFQWAGESIEQHQEAIVPNLTEVQ
jgi:D-glycero-D-manno-heptose 1,7-bisphosphate phosphatase